MAKPIEWREPLPPSLEKESVFKGTMPLKVEALRSPLMAKPYFPLLLQILTYMNQNYECHITPAQLSKDSNLPGDVIGRYLKMILSERVGAQQMATIADYRQKGTSTIVKFIRFHEDFVHRYLDVQKDWE